MNNSICLWSCPRNVSTALMYSFAQRSDTEIFDEVLYAHYLSETGIDHPGREIIMKTQENNGEKVVQNLILKERSKVSFFKLMTHFLVNLNTNFLNKVQNIILIRNPKEIIHSYNKVIPNPSIEDIGVKMQYELYQDLLKLGSAPLVLDAEFLLKDPKGILVKLCDLLNISFEEGMLSWEKGGRKEDGKWAEYWYKDVHNSTSFIPYYKRLITLSGSNLILANKCKPYYEYLYNNSIKL